MHGGFYLFIKQCNNLLVNKNIKKKLNILKVVLCFQGFDSHLHHLPCSFFMPKEKGPYIVLSPLFYIFSFSKVPLARQLLAN
jgi:hypothetical protein